MAWALNIKVGDPLSKLVLLGLANHANHLGECFPSRKRIAEYAECSVDTVDRRLSVLCKKSLVSKSARRAENGDQTSNSYQLNMGPLLAATPAAISGHPAAEPSGPNHHVRKGNPDGFPKGVGQKGSSIKSKDRKPTTEAAIRIAKLFNRRLETEWTEKEIAAFKKLHPINLDDLTLVEAYYAAERAKPRGIQRRDLQTFLNNFLGEVDRAKQWKDKQKPAAPPQAEDEGF